MMTDDCGHFRFYGLPAGKYAVKAALPTVQAVGRVRERALLKIDTTNLVLQVPNPPAKAAAGN